MDEGIVDGVILSELGVFALDEGDVLHGIKNSDVGFSGFGEAYFSFVKWNKIKAWKRHNSMTLNLVVPVGCILFVIIDDRNTSESCGIYQKILLSRDNYYRLTIPPKVWLGFKGCANESSLLLNIADIPHEPSESDRKDVDEFAINWDIER